MRTIAFIPVTAYWLSVMLICLALNARCYAAIFVDNDPKNGIEDERQPPTPELSLATGTIFCDGIVRGTAAHVNHRKVRQFSVIHSAAHVLFDPNSGQPFRDCYYHPQHQRLSAIPFAEISAHQFNPKSDDKIAQSETDFVFIALKWPVNQPTLELKIQPLKQAQKLSLLGYNPRQDKLSLSKNCRSFNSAQFQSDTLLYHNCDAEGGASGGPIFVEGSTDIIAIHGGTLFVHHNLSAGAQANPERWINQARKVDRGVISRLEEFVASLK